MKQSNPEKQESNEGTTPQASPNTTIDASDANRNDERDQRIREEPGTERLRSERESTQSSDSA
jgi:hypothetical protein